MKVIQHNVSVRDKLTKKSRVVKTIDITVYDTLDELLAAEAEGDIVSNFNRQNVQDLANATRVAFTQGPSRKVQDGEILRFLTTPEQVQRLVAVAGQPAKLDALYESVRAELFPVEGDSSDE